MSGTHDLRTLWLRVVASFRGELEGLREEHRELRLEHDVAELFETHRPAVRQAAIKGIARDEASGNERQYRDAYRQDQDLPRDYPFAHTGEDFGR